MIRIDEEFKSLIPPLSADEYAGLEKSLLDDGCRDSLVLWGDTLIGIISKFTQSKTKT